MRYKVSQYAKKYGVSIRTVWNWFYKGQVKFNRTDNGHIFIIEDENINLNDSVAIYARVSSSQNENNLVSQKQRLLDYCAAKGYKVVKVVTEFGSGLNDKRPKLEALLTDNSVKKIVVEHSDRFARFGVNYIQKLLNMQGRDIEIINQAEDDKNELMDDFISIVTSFCERLYGLRRNKIRTEKLIKELQNA